MLQAELLPFGDAAVLQHLPDRSIFLEALPQGTEHSQHREWLGHKGTVYPAAPDSKDQPNNTLLFIGQLHISRPTDAQTTMFGLCFC